jgi:Domain of unknown function (DUF1937)
MSEVIPFTRPKIVGISGLRIYPLIFLSTPYSRYNEGLQAAFEAACRLAGRLVINGLSIYSPIAHSHPIAFYGEINPLDVKLWMRLNEPHIKAASAILVAEMAGWKDSDGVKSEMDAFALAGKPIYFVNPNSLALR